MLILALGILCGLATTVFATLEPRPARAAALWLAAAAITALALGFSQVPDPVFIGLGIVVCAVTALARPEWSWLAVAGGGAAGAIWVSLLVALGLPAPLALIVPLAIVATTIYWTAARPSFAPRALREEALVLVGTFALIVAGAPAVGAGFGAAIALKAEPLGGDTIATGQWPLLLAAGCLLLGGVYSIWRRR